MAGAFVVSTLLIFARFLAPPFARFAGTFVEFAGGRCAGLFGFRCKAARGLASSIGGSIRGPPFTLAFGISLLLGLARGQKDRDNSHDRQDCQARCAHALWRGTIGIADRVRVRAGFVGIRFRSWRESGRIRIWVFGRHFWFHRNLFARLPPAMGLRARKA